MSSVPIPAELAQEISELAVRRAREGIRRRNWSVAAQESIFPNAKEGQVGIGTTLKYLWYQEKGTKPFLMTALEGKIVPIKGRFFRVRGVGLPGMGYQDRKYDPFKGPIWREQRWRHPGIRPENFMRNAVQQALFESRSKVRTTVMSALVGAEPTPRATPNDMPRFLGRPIPTRPTPNVMPRRAGWR